MTSASGSSGLWRHSMGRGVKTMSTMAQGRSAGSRSLVPRCRFDLPATLSWAAVDRSALRVKHRLIGAGAQSGMMLECTELVLLSGRAGVLHVGNGEAQEMVTRPDMVSICPAGTCDSQVELSAPMDCLYLLLPPTLVARSALADYDFDPAKVRLAYTGGFTDPKIGSAFQELLGRSAQSTDRLFVDGQQVALAATCWPITRSTAGSRRPLIPGV